MSEDDPVREVAIEQGWVPSGCLLPGGLIWALMNTAEDPCAGCNENRQTCGGRPKSYRYEHGILAGCNPVELERGPRRRKGTLHKLQLTPKQQKAISAAVGKPRYRFTPFPDLKKKR
jgi:hypothetical protein